MGALKNIKHERFASLYVSKEFFGNGTLSYCEAYGIDPQDKRKYFGAATNAHELLKNTKILTRINELLEDGGLNDAFVDKQLLFAVTQNADLSSKVKAINEYNKLRQRLIEKAESIVKLEPIEVVIVQSDKPLSSSESQVDVSN